MKLSCFQFAEFLNRAESLGWDVVIENRNLINYLGSSDNYERYDVNVYCSGVRKSFMLYDDDVVSVEYEDILLEMEDKFREIDERNKKAEKRKALIESLTAEQRELLEL